MTVLDAWGKPVNPPDPTTCDHGVTFDEVKARKLLDAAPKAKSAVDFIIGNSNANEVKKRWPRGWFTAKNPCPKGCPYKGIYYASEMHYLMGDW